jgi:hypothetical protein
MVGGLLGGRYPLSYTSAQCGHDCKTRLNWTAIAAAHHGIERVPDLWLQARPGPSGWATVKHLHLVVAQVIPKL